MAFCTDGPLVQVIDADGSNRRILAFGYQPVWSPDGRTILFANRDGIARMDADGGGVELVIPHTFSLSPDSDIEIFPVAWSPGGRIYFQWYHPGNDFSKLYTMNEEGSDVRQLDIASEFSLVDAQTLALSPDGSKLAFSNVANGRPLVGSVNVDGSDYRILVTSDVDFASPVAWSPDHRQIAFTRRGRIWTVNVADGTLRQLIFVSGPTGSYVDLIGGWLPAR